jgi:chemosensory pili system protein ChpA (sensor histidine kinase/response regulator)
VVNTEVKQVGGFISIASSPRQGTCFTITLPLTLATQHVLMARIDNNAYALPLTGFMGIARISSEEYQQLLETEVPKLTQGGREYRILSLDKILGNGNSATYLKRKNVPLLLFRLNDHHVALHADTLNGHHEIVMKPLGPQANSVQEICGGTIMGDGSVVLIIDLATIVRVHLANQGQKLMPSQVDEQKQHREQKLMVMVVDDSLTVRKVTSRFIERNGMEAVTARDGFDAVEKLDGYIPDIILLDVEMPRMDGFEFATFVRNTEKYKHLPIIMISSRTGDKHRERAEHIGVNLYLGKPYNEQELLESIHELAKRTTH